MRIFADRRFFRLRVVKDLTDISQHVGVETFTKEILPHLKSFADDKEGAVLQSFAEQLGHLCLYLVKVRFGRECPTSSLRGLSPSLVE